MIDYYYFKMLSLVEEDLFYIKDYFILNDIIYVKMTAHINSENFIEIEEKVYFKLKKLLIIQ